MRLWELSSDDRRPASRLKRRLCLESLESRRLLAALPLGASPWDTAEYMLGRVAVVPILFESNGQIDADTEDWDAASIDAALSKIEQGLQWWVDALDSLGTAHELEFVIDDQFARAPFETPYELISRTSQSHTTALGSFLQAEGYGSEASLEAAIKAFNHDARLRLETDWAFSIVLINSANDADGMFASGSEFGQAFAYPGGQYIVSPSTRPISTITHEVGHIFWARDEYPGGGSWTDHRGYYNAQNWNAANNPTPGFVQEPSIMRSGGGLNESYQTYRLPESTMAMIGWRDSDGNGVFDVLDVPLKLTGSGYYDAASQRFVFTGQAAAVALPNQNSSGHQNDITLNRVDRIEYRLDGGVWQTALTVGQPTVELQFQIDVGPFEQLQLRAIDDSVGVTSAVYQTTGNAPLLAGATLGGWAYHIDDSSAPALPPTPQGLSPGTTQITAQLSLADGSPLPSGRLDPNEFAVGSELTQVGATSLSAIGSVVDDVVVVLPSATDPQRQVWGMFNRQTGDWESAWTPDRSLSIAFDSPIGEVSLEAWGLRGWTWPSYARLEAYDADGNLIARTTSDRLERGDSQRLTVHDPNGRIVRIRAVGHAASNVEFGQLQYGVSDSQTVGPGGAFHFSGLADGDYRLQLTSQNLVYQPIVSEQVVRVVDGTADWVDAEFRRVRSPWHNPLNHADVDVSGTVEPLDALLILNSLSRGGGPRVLQDPQPNEPFYDTNNDGLITPLDALVVLTQLSQQRQSGSGESAPVGKAGAHEQVFATWPMPFERRETTAVDEKIHWQSNPIGLLPPLNR